LKSNTQRQRKLRENRRADEVCLSCGEPRHKQRKYCSTCLDKDKRRKNQKSQEHARQGRCPWCGNETCYAAWNASPASRDEGNKLRKTCLKRWAAGVPDQLPERLRKLWIQYYGPENLLHKYGWPGVLDEITEEQLFLLKPPTKAAIRRFEDKLPRQQESRGLDIGHLVMEFLRLMTDPAEMSEVVTGGKNSSEGRTP